MKNKKALWLFLGAVVVLFSSQMVYRHSIDVSPYSVITGDLQLDDSNASDELTITWDDNDTSDRTLGLKVNGAAAVLQIEGVTAALDQDLTADASPLFADLVLTDEGELRMREATGGGTSYTGFKAPAALSGNVIYTMPDADGTIGQALKTDGAGGLEWAASGGVGGVTYIDNGDFEATANAALPDGWVVYVDAAGIAPVDGTGGSATSTFLGDTTNNIRGLTSGTISKPSTNEQGEGISYDFTIDPADNASVMKIAFDYVTSANFDYGTNGDATDPSDITVWIYDKDGTQLRQPIPYTLDGSGKYEGYFQTDATNDDYRLILHMSIPDEPTGTAWTMQIDGPVTLGPSAQAHGPAMSDFKECTTDPTWTNLTVSSQECTWKRIGDEIIVKGALIMSAASGGDLFFGLPGGLTIDNSAYDNAYPIVGHADATDDTASETLGADVQVLSSTTMRFLDVGIAANQVWDSDADTPWNWAINDTIRYSVQVKVLGWSSNTLVSSDADTRVISSRQYRNAAYNIATAETTIPFDTDAHDRSNSMTAGVFTAPSSGVYVPNAMVQSAAIAIGAGEQMILRFYKNGSARVSEKYWEAMAATTAVQSWGLTDEVELNAGDTLELKITHNLTGGAFAMQVGSTSESFFSVSKKTGPAQIAASEVVNFYAWENTDRTVSGNTEIVLDQEVEDSHGGYDTATGRFSAKVSGNYRFSAGIKAEMGGTASAKLQCWFYKNGTGAQYGTFYEDDLTNSKTYGVAITSQIKLEVGDYVSVWCANTTNTWHCDTNATHHWLSFSGERIGGVMFILIPFWCFVGRRRKEHVFDEFKLAA